MSKQRLRGLSLLAALGMVSGGSAYAQEVQGGFYFGLSGGITSFDVSQQDFDDDISSALEGALGTFALEDMESTLDDSSKGWGVQIGYRWTRYFAAEIGYQDLGKFLYEGGYLFIDDTIPAAAVFGADVRGESSGPSVSLLGMLPVGDGRFDLYARAGVYFSDTRVRMRAVDASDPDSLVSVEGKTTSDDLFFGVGGTWNINDSYSVRLEYQRFPNVGDKRETGEFDIDLITVGFLFR